MKYLQKLLSRENLINYIFIFYLFSIILDLHIFYNSISTLIRVGFITILFLIIYFKYATKKERKLLLIYFFILIIYIGLHLWNASLFSIPFNTVFRYSSEILYFIKMFMNVFLIFIIYKLQYDKDKFYKLISLSAFLISLSIVICNIFKIGYTSYSFEPVTYNIFDWFTIPYIDYAISSSKGYFHLTNQISAILVLYLPIILIKLKEKINLFNIINVILIILSLFILGTRISSYSTFIILIAAFIFYLITSFMQNEKLNYKYGILMVLLLVLSLTLYNVCPLLSRNVLYDNMFNEEVPEKQVEEVTEPIILSDLSIEELKEYINDFNISSNFYNFYYPIEVDREFYENYVSMNTTKINDTRFLELQVIKRVKSLNNNKLDKYLGIGYDRVMNIFNIESDYVMQYYALGILGVILILGVNIVILMYMGFKTIFNMKKYFKYENLMLIFSIFYFLVSSYFTGNILNATSTIIPISFVIGYALSNINKKSLKEDYEYFLGFKTSTKSMEDIEKEIFESKNQVIIYNINPLIIMNFRKNKKVLNEFNQEKFNIPDGNGIVLASKLKSDNIKKSIPGIELVESICQKSIEKKYKIYLYGAKESSVKNTKINLEKKYQNIQIVGYKNGYTKKEEVLKDILKCKPDILFVALGSPLQENFIIENKDKFKDIKIIMPVGGTFDVFSNNIKRAPKIFRKLKLEWLYRMIKEPKRFKQLFILGQFLFLVLFGNFWYNNNELEENL